MPAKTFDLLRKEIALMKLSSVSNNFRDPNAELFRHYGRFDYAFGAHRNSS